MIFAGFDTTARSLSSTIFNLKRYPDKLEKLKSELSKVGLQSTDEKSEKQLLEAYNNCDYLTYAIKEGLRLDPPTPESLNYKAIKDTEICGVKIYKNEKLNISILYSHFNPDIYHRPLEFIPERFDPESELFFKPSNSKEKRHPKSHVPFTYGLRTCVGQSLAKLESKVLLSRFIEKVDFDINKEILENPSSRFNLADMDNLKGRINSVK